MAPSGYSGEWWGSAPPGKAKRGAGWASRRIAVGCAVSHRAMRVGVRGVRGWGGGVGRGGLAMNGTGRGGRRGSRGGGRGSWSPAAVWCEAPEKMGGSYGGAAGWVGGIEALQPEVEGEGRGGIVEGEEWVRRGKGRVEGRCTDARTVR